MNTKVSDLFDAYNGELPSLSEKGPIKAKTIEKLANGKIHSCEAKKAYPARRIRLGALIAAAVALLTIAAFAKTPQIINGPENAVAAVNTELGVMRGMNIISADFSLDPADCTVTLQNDGHLFCLLSRKFDPFYNINYTSGKYYGNLNINAVTGKITQFTIIARADSGDEPIGSFVMDGKTINLYANFEDIFDTSLTLDNFCQKLCDYWDYTGFTIAATGVDDFAPTTLGGNAAAMLCDHGDGQAKRTTLKFFGDQAGEVQYIEVGCYGDGACLMAGFAHSLG